MMWIRPMKTTHIIAYLVTNTNVSSERTTQSLVRTAAFSPQASYVRLSTIPLIQVHRMLSPRKIITKQHMSFFGRQDEGGIMNIDRAAMMEIIEDVVNSSREESGYVIIDVRGHDEIQSTGKLNDVVVTLPLPYIAQGALAMDEEDFKEAFGFEKPQLDETLVFSCKAGIRSNQAGQLAKMAGYSNVLNYMGGSNEWFS
jgi:rhodanese-related sulfurtransferase